MTLGYTKVSGSDWDFAMARYNSDGSLDTTFDTDGKLTTPFGSGNTDYAHDLAVQPDGKVVVGGSTTPLGGTPDFALARYSVGLEERVYAQWDANFNVTSLVDQDGTVLERFEYTPYGEVTVLDANWSADADTVSDYGWNYLHQGGRLDANTGLYHFRNRDYSPTLGRWVQQDPMAYVDGDELVRVRAVGFDHSARLIGIAAPERTAKCFRIP